LANFAVNHLFPPESVNDLKTWRFILHFKAPFLFRDKKLRKAVEQLQADGWKIIEFSAGLDGLEFDAESKTVGIPIEVSEEKRRQPNSLEDYESDFWKICGTMTECGFGELFYEAVDWEEEDAVEE